jgi:hypothetical protein
LFAVSGLDSTGFSSAFKADLNPRIPSPNPLPSSGSFLGPKMRSAIPAMIQQVHRLKQAFKHLGSPGLREQSSQKRLASHKQDNR